MLVHDIVQRKSDSSTPPGPQGYGVQVTSYVRIRPPVVLGLNTLIDDMQTILIIAQATLSTTSRSRVMAGRTMLGERRNVFYSSRTPVLYPVLGSGFRFRPAVTVVHY